MRFVKLSVMIGGINYTQNLKTSGIILYVPSVKPLAIFFSKAWFSVVSLSSWIYQWKRKVNRQWDSLAKSLNALINACNGIEGLTNTKQFRFHILQYCRVLVCCYFCCCCFFFLLEKVSLVRNLQKKNSILGIVLELRVIDASSEAG